MPYREAAMANVLNTDKQIAVISALAEGKPRRHLTALHTRPIESAQDASRVAFAQELRLAEES